MDREINTIHNKYIQYVRNLFRRKIREEEGRFVAEGLRFVEETLKSDWVTETVLYTSSLAQTERGQALLETARARRVRLIRVAEAVMARLGDTKNPQGVLAVVQQQQFHPEQLLETAVRAGTADPFLGLAVDALQDPGNLGNLIRTADAAGGDGLLVGPGTVDVFNAKTLRATMGSVFAFPIATTADLAGMLGRFREAGVQVVAAAGSAPTVFYDVDFRRSTIIVLGNEGAGLAPEILAAADIVARIPILGRAESLNVAAAGSIMLYEAVRQRRS